ncbi:MAG TPA: hypothetical protein DEA47_03395 [Peptococcaceae bacterium]|nr:MAG: NADH-quinone oxidoreductase subunit [Clostridia bacterium 41_269]HBT20395.1 hypothetical protein [Peptococcaceae bacterium]
MDGNLSLALPPIAFIIFTIVAYLLMGMGKMMAVPFKDVEGKTDPYLCGEDLALGMIVPSYWQFFSIAILFTILHIAVFIVALMPSPAVLFTIIYIILIGSAVGVLIGEVKLTIPPKEKAVAKLQARAKIIDRSATEAVESGGAQVVN